MNAPTKNLTYHFVDHVQEYISRFLDFSSFLPLKSLFDLKITNIRQKILVLHFVLKMGSKMVKTTYSQIIQKSYFRSFTIRIDRQNRPKILKWRGVKVGPDFSQFFGEIKG